MIDAEQIADSRVIVEAGSAIAAGAGSNNRCHHPARARLTG
jgi:hypothetical protein